MITCPWCGTSYTTFRSNCKNCGGPLPPPAEATATPPPIPDLPEPPPPPLHPGTHDPIGPDDLAPLFPMALIGQEVSKAFPFDVADCFFRDQLSPHLLEDRPVSGPL